MLALMKQHGRMLLCCVAAILVLAIAFKISMDGKRGMIQIAAGKAAEQMEPVTIRTDRDANAVLAAAARRSPEITYHAAKVVSKTIVNLRAMFSAVDADGAVIAVEITDILDISGKSVLYQTEEQRKNKTGIYDTKGFVFPSAGIYIVYVKAVDAEKKEVCMKYKIPVAGS